MKHAILKRFAQTPFGVFGELILDGQKWYTVERCWDDNKPFVSCIPAGIYPLVPSYYYHGDYPCYEIADVPGRTYIKIHKANKSKELMGCIAPGVSLSGWDDSPSKPFEWAMKDSTAAFDQIMVALKSWTDEGHDIQLHVQDPQPMETHLWKPE